MNEEKPKRGFAALSLDRRRELASMGGKATRPENRTFSKSRELASSAGKKGGKAVPDANRSFSRDRDLATRAAKKGIEALYPPPRHVDLDEHGPDDEVAA